MEAANDRTQESQENTSEDLFQAINIAISQSQLFSNMLNGDSHVAANKFSAESDADYSIIAVPAVSISSSRDALNK
jgi:hypothetical protein